MVRSGVRSQGSIKGGWSCATGDSIGVIRARRGARRRHAPAHMAFDQAKYPDLKGQWSRMRFPGVAGQPSFDQTKSAGDGQQAPLTPEYQLIFEENLKDQAAGGQGIDPTSTCLSPGMPRIMTAYEPMEFVITPETTHILMEHIHDSRRIYTDGRSFPEEHRAVVRGLFHRAMARPGRQRPLQRARGRDPRLQGAAHLRRRRHSAAQGQPDRHHRALPSRQGQQGRAGGRDHHQRPCPDAALDGDQALQARGGHSSRSGASRSARRTTATCRSAASTIT